MNCARLPSICHRCLQPVPRAARACPHCGIPLERLNPHRIAYVAAAAVGLALALTLAGWLLWRIMLFGRG